MFFKGSRYKDLPDISVTDSDRQRIRSKTLRWIPETRGTFQHTVNQTDRLDLLSYKYYGDPKKWWLICDANPEFALPTDLLNLNLIVHEIFTLYPPNGDNKWALLIRGLQNLRGVHEVYTEVFKATLDVTYNEKEITQKKIKDAIEAQDFEIGNVSKKERFGKKITIPPNRII